ncbi:MAG TPA: tRNA (adenosine(37)-N6)-threonylcarbamoyltransferase complex ATPase subunit type 1 TsaE [Patescibacteria group bacterium]|nr:tRNA (adenosine(37)-N6)-threonylcarbamoyltransferase complex ATPase subunit type 1 TsaE [Patescibacteria group bacterium]
MDKTVITNSAEETQKLAEDLVQHLDKNFIALFGNLGSGKTTFTQGMARGLGIEERVISPTFIIVREHKIKIQNSELRIENFYHIDLYRIQSNLGIEGLGLEEIIDDSKNIVVVEWAEKIKYILPKKRLEIYFEYLKKDKRKIIFKNYE